MLGLVLNYSRVLKKIFEQNRKEVKVGWKKLLDTELHELYHLIDTLVKKLRAIVTEPIENIEEKRKA